MQRDIAYLLDIMESARLALDYVKGKTRVEFIDDLQCQDAVIRRLEIIGEAANRILLSGSRPAIFSFWKLKDRTLSVIRQNAGSWMNG